MILVYTYAFYWTTLTTAYTWPFWWYMSTHICSVPAMLQYLCMHVSCFIPHSPVLMCSFVLLYLVMFFYSTPFKSMHMNLDLYFSLVSCHVIVIHVNIHDHMCMQSISLYSYICQGNFIMWSHRNTSPCDTSLLIQFHMLHSPPLSIDLFMCALLHQFLAYRRWWCVVSIMHIDGRAPSGCLLPISEVGSVFLYTCGRPATRWNLPKLS